MATAIEWTDETWNCLRGCTRVSPGCQKCYAERQALRFGGAGMPYEGLVKISNGHPQWTGEVLEVSDSLDKPLRWRQPKRIFVNSMSDCFHEDVSNSFLDRMFAVMALCPQHTFQILTKRPDRMLKYVNEPGRMSAIVDEMSTAAFDEWTLRGRSGKLPACATLGKDSDLQDPLIRITPPGWPLPNVWLGVSVENQKYANERIPILLQAKAAIRFLSVEPMLGRVNIGLFGVAPRDWGVGYAPLHTLLHWVICGGESGPGARPLNLAWVDALQKECREAQVPFFMKQLGSNPQVHSCRNESCTHPDCGMEEVKLNSLKGGAMEEWPQRFRVREFPA